MKFGTTWKSSLPASIGKQPEELLRAGDGIGVRTRRAGKVRERSGAGGGGLQTEDGVHPFSW